MRLFESVLATFTHLQRPQQKFLCPSHEAAADVARACHVPQLKPLQSLP